MKIKLLTLLRIIFGLIVLLGLFYYVGFEKIISTLLKTNPFFILLFIVLVIIIFMIEAFNYRLLLQDIHKISYFQFFKYYLTSWSLGLFSPGRVGDLSLIYFLKKDGLDLGRGSAMYFFGKFLSVFILLVASGLGFFVFLTKSEAIKLLSILIALFAIFAIILFSKKIRQTLTRLILRKYAENFRGFSKTIKFYIQKRKITTIFVFLSTLFKTFLQALAVLLVFFSLSESPPFMAVFYIFAMTNILSLIPITLSGLGIREATSVFLYGLIGIAAPITAGVYFLIMVIQFLLAIITLSIVKINISFREKQTLSKSN